MSEEKKDLNDIEEVTEETPEVTEEMEEVAEEAEKASEENLEQPTLEFTPESVEIQTGANYAESSNYPAEADEEDEEEEEVPQSFFKRLFSNPIFSCVLLVILVCGCAFFLYWNVFRNVEEPPIEVKPESVIATVGDQKIYAYEVSAYCKIGMDVDKALEFMIEEKHYLQLAKDKKITLTQEETDMLNQYIAEMGESFAVQAVQFGLTADQYKQLLFNDQLAQKVSSEIYTLELKGFTEKDQKKFYNEKFLRAKHVLIPFTEGDDESEEAALATATTVAERLNNGEDIDALIEEYPNDPGSVTNPDGYIFLDHTKVKLTDETKASLSTASLIMTDAFTKAAAKLEIGAVSEPVKTEYGYHVIVRLDLNETEEMFDKNQILTFNVMRTVNEDAYKKVFEKNKPVINEELRDALIIKTYREEHALPTQMLPY